MPNRTWTDEQFIEAVQTSHSIVDVLIKLKLGIHSRNYDTFYYNQARLNLNISHFTGKTVGRRNIKPLSEILIKDSRCGDTYRIKNRLLKEKVLPYLCYICKITEWLEKPISLELHHINGDSRDHRIENLQLLCPNCHSQTESYAKRKDTVKKEKICLKCKKTFLGSKNRKFCSTKCSGQYNANTYLSVLPKKRKVVNRPNKEELIKLITDQGYCAVGKMFGVSDNAVRKWLK